VSGGSFLCPGSNNIDHVSEEVILIAFTVRLKFTEFGHSVDCEDEERHFLVKF
jgi:hypothetical protein